MASTFWETMFFWAAQMQILLVLPAGLIATKLIVTQAIAGFLDIGVGAAPVCKH